MGSPLSPIAADIVLCDLESRALTMLPMHLPFYVRYVDDVALAAPSSMFKDILHTFNSFHPRLQFTMEESVGNQLDFLDVSIIINENIIEFDWFHKPTYSGRYLNFESWHPICHKRGTILGLIDRAFLLTNPKYHQKNIEFVINTLLNNDYPLTYIFKVINDRLKKLMTKKQTLQPLTYNDAPTNRDDILYSNIPYFLNISDKFKHIMKNTNITMSYTGMNKLNPFIKVQKDKLTTDQHSNVVYKISCADCGASYVGQTRRLLLTKIKEHRSHISRNTLQKSVITNHRLTGHEFKWEEVEVLDREPILNKRLTSEMIFIKRQKNSLNMQSDTDNLNAAYIPLLENFSTI